MIALHREATGVLVIGLSEHLSPEDLELAIPVVHDVARARQNPLLLLVEIHGFDMSPCAFLCQILQSGILAQNRPSRVAVLTTIAEESAKQVPEVQIRFFLPEQRYEAKAWLLSFATPIRYLQFWASSVTSRLWEGWRDPAMAEWLRTCTIITAEPVRMRTFSCRLNLNFGANISSFL